MVSVASATFILRRPTPPITTDSRIVDADGFTWQVAGISRDNNRGFLTVQCRREV